jgi:hypothetical protein
MQVQHVIVTTYEKQDDATGIGMGKPTIVCNAWQADTSL